MFIKFIKSVFFRPVAILMAFMILSMSFTYPTARTVVLKSGTIVPMELLTALTSQNARNGQLVSIRVTSDVKVGKDVVIEAGSIAQGQVTKISKNGLMGEAGELEVTIKSVKAVDGSTIFLTGGNLWDEGNSKLAISIVFTVLCLFGFLIKGGKAELAAGTQLQGVVASDTEISLE